VFLRQSQPGFTGSDFQAFLSFEDAYGTCRYPFARFPTPDLLDDLLVRGAKGPIEDVVRALRDRIVSDEALTEAEKVLVAELVGADLSTPVAKAPADLRDALGTYCGALALSPQAWLVVEPRIGATIPALAVGLEADCALLASLLAVEGVTVTCDGHRPETAAP